MTNMLLITFYNRAGYRVQFVCDSFAYATMVMGTRSYGWKAF